MGMPYTFSFNSMIRGYHRYIMIWNNPIAGEELTCHHEAGNSHDPYAITVKKLLAEKRKLSGMYPGKYQLFAPYLLEE